MDSHGVGADIDPAGERGGRAPETSHVLLPSEYRDGPPPLPLSHDLCKGRRRGHPPNGLEDPMPRRGRKVREYTPRDPRFRRDVLEAYDERRAVCEYNIRFGDRLLGLEAAHIRWHSNDGRDVGSEWVGALRCAP